MSRSTLILLIAVAVATTLAEPNKGKQHHFKNQHPWANSMPSQSVAADSNPLASQQGASRRPPLQIVGGQAASLGQFPYQVAIRHQHIFVCSGILIAPNYVLTYGLCVSPFGAVNVTVVAGSVSLSGVTGQTLYVNEIIVHPDLQPATLKNDIALLRLSSSVRCTKDVQPIKLEAAEMRGGEVARAIGWGYTSYPNPKTETDILQFVDLTIISNDVCRTKLPSASTAYLHPSNLCTDGVVGKGVCYLDGGGPLVVGGKLVGIPHRVEACAQGYPDMYVRVSSFVEWITSIINSGNCCFIS